MRRFAPLCLAVLLGACAAVERLAPAGDLVAYLARLRGMNEFGLAAEATRQREMARSQPSDLAQIKVAIALSLSAQAEEGEILSLVEPVARRDAAEDDHLRAMASFLQVQASERRRLRESAAAAGAKLRDERRAVEAQKQRADALQERVAQLQQKLDALTELEKSLSDRPAQGR